MSLTVLVFVVVVGLVRRGGFGGGIAERFAANADVPPEMQAKVDAVRKKVDDLVTLETEERDLLKRMADGLRRRPK